MIICSTLKEKISHSKKIHTGQKKLKGDERKNSLQILQKES